MDPNDTKLLLEETSKNTLEANIEPKTLEVLNKILNTLLSMNNRIAKIETEVEKIEDVKQQLSSVVQRMDHVENNIADLQQHNKEMENSFEGMGQVVEKALEKCELNRNDIEKIEETTMQEKSIIKELQETVLDLKCRSMKNNLVFNGLTYHPSEDCEAKLQDFINRQLGIEYMVTLGNVHRFGKYGRNGARPIVARFVYRKELEHVLKQAYRLKNTNFGINEQFPPEIEIRRRKLYPIFKKEKSLGKQARLVRDKLYINGQLFNPENININPANNDREIINQRTPSTPQHREAANSPPIPPRSKRTRTESDTAEKSR
ncbi:unnamed protein product [Mytilus edulis]|uniref:L1 transposable element RRM domain-containing protein n=1 Tax=Mytilus edulis TaxID=6550 RepID=A0A8S3PQE4_MYTED|nr:unnamed protein product [Mytilus edulis]